MIEFAVIVALFAFAVAGAAVAFHNHAKLAALKARVEADAAHVKTAVQSAKADIAKV